MIKLLRTLLSRGVYIVAILAIAAVIYLSYDSQQNDKAIKEATKFELCSEPLLESKSYLNSELTNWSCGHRQSEPERFEKHCNRMQRCSDYYKINTIIDDFKYNRRSIKNNDMVTVEHEANIKCLRFNTANYNSNSLHNIVCKITMESSKSDYRVNRMLFDFKSDAYDFLTAMEVTKAKRLYLSECKMFNARYSRLACEKYSINDIGD